MIYELRTYQLLVGKLPEYLQTVKTKMLPVLAEHGHDAIKRRINRVLRRIPFNDASMVSYSGIPLA